MLAVSDGTQIQQIYEDNILEVLFTKIWLVWHTGQRLLTLLAVTKWLHN